MQAYPELALFIDGRWRPGSDGAGEEVLNPANGAVLGVLPHASAADLDEALAAAARGLRVWRAVAPHDRAKLLRRAAEILRSRAEAVATALTLEQGKPLAEALAEVASAADVTDWFAEEGRRAHGRVIAGRDPETRYLVLKEPVGVSLSLTPWNFPINTPSRKIAAALAAGCSVIAKAAEETPAACIEYVRAFADAGLPDGVLNLVFGVPETVSQHLIGSGTVRKLSFTGSVPVGRRLAALAAGNLQRTTMELGGHAPVIVFDDVDVDAVLDVVVRNKFRKAGQVCISPTRFYVQEAVHDRFAQGFAARAAALRLGSGLDPQTEMGPLANRRRLDAMDAHVADARGHGARVLTGGARVGNAGFHYAPTVLADVPETAAVMTQEPFGPIAALARFATLDEAAERANGLDVGLAAYAFTGSIDRGRRIADALETGLLGLNTVAVALPETPFGGVKASGWGSEGGTEGIEPYLTVKTVAERRALG